MIGGTAIYMERDICRLVNTPVDGVESLDRIEDAKTRVGYLVVTLLHLT